MNILVTGGHGFIGRALLTELTIHGHKAWPIDREDGDLTQVNEFRRQLDRHQPDLVVHLAAQVGRLFGEDNVKHTIASNATMTAFVAQACYEAEVPLLYASTSEVYGDQGNRVCHEDGVFRLPHNLYGLSKRWGEEVARLYSHEGLKIVRFSMPYGPGAPPGRGRRAMDNMLWQALHGMPITVHRGAERSWCYLTDTVRAVRLVIEEGRPDAYNVGRDDHPVSMLEIARRACWMMGADESLIHEVDPPHAQTVVKRLDTSRVRLLGWEPEVELTEGMTLLAEWVRQFDKDGRKRQAA